MQQQLQLEKGVKISERSSPAAPQVGAEGGAGGAAGAGAEIPLQPVVKTHGEAGCALQPWRLTLEQISTCSHGGPHTGAGGCPKEAVTCGKPVLEQAPGGTCDPMERGAQAGAGLLAGPMTPRGTHAGAVGEELQPVGRTNVGEVRGGLTPVGRTPHWSKGRV